MATLRALLADAGAALAAGPHAERARLDAETLLLHRLQQDRAWLLLHKDEEAEAEAEADYLGLVQRRATGEPLQYITGSSEFFGLPFSVGPGVLIPRPETEHLVEEVLRIAGEMRADPLRIADIGTGSGIIAVALAHALPRAEITAIDLSAQALVVARENAEKNGVGDRIRFFEGDLLARLDGERFDILASNPPYLPTADHDSLAVEVRAHEPHSALFAGEDGLAIYRRLIPEALSYLDPGGWLVMEIGFGQEAALDTLLRDHGYTEVRFVPDYQGISRVAVGRR